VWKVIIVDEVTGEITHITKDITGEWRDIGALMDQWIQECPYNRACIKGGECERQLPPVETGGLRRSRDRLNLIRTKGACQTVRGLVPRTQALFVPAG